MNAVKTTLDPNRLRDSLLGFWSGALEIRQTEAGLAIAMPQTGADGWQLVLEITEPTPGMCKVSDKGRTLGGLSAMGQNIESEGISGEIGRILQQSHLQARGIELFRILPAPIDPVELHVFAEALAAITHLHVLHEPVPRVHDVVDVTLQRVFTDRRMNAKRGASLSGKTEKSVRVDYLVQPHHPVAFQILRRRGRLLSVMEQWGYRWQDLKKVTPTLVPVMLYDAANQEVDDASRAIGEEVCSLFCAYDETDRIHGVLDQASH